MKNLKTITGIFCVWVSIHTAYCQDNYALQFTQHHGKTLAITNNFPETGFSSVTEFNFGYRTNGSKYWHKRFFYPTVGWTIAYQQFGNPQTLGGGISTQPFASLYRRYPKNWSIESRTGLGIAFFNKSHDAITNPQNTMIGSLVTASFSQYFGIAKEIQNFGAHVGVSFWHWSNGHTAVPNVGGNFAAYSLGVRYLLKNKNSQPPSVTKVDSINKKTSLDVALGLGIHEIEGTFVPVDGTKYLTYGLTIAGTKRVGPVAKLTMGVDVNYYTAFHEQIVNQEIFTDHYRLNSLNLVGFLGHEFLFGRVAFITQLGYNIYAPFRVEMANYENINSLLGRYAFVRSTNKVGFRYYWSTNHNEISKKIYTEINLKTIFAKADLIQIKVGYNL